MSIDALLLASGDGWRVHDIRCTAGPRDRPFEEQHDGACVAVVRSGTFTYRTTHGSAVLGPGATLLGNHGHCFECGHEHGAGDRCLSFRFAPALLEQVVSELPGARTTTFAAPALPPIPQLIPVVAAVDAARYGDAGVCFEEIALDVISTVANVVIGMEGGRRSAARRTNLRDQGRISGVLRRMELESSSPLSLQELAHDAAMSPFHFLRTFRAVTGVTPHQYLLHTRLQRAAVRLRCSNDSIASIAAEAGFGDLSTFNRRFRRLLGVRPSECRSGKA